MKELKRIATMIMILLVAGLSACNVDQYEPAPTKGTNNEDPVVEGTYTGTWELTNDRMPTASMKDKYEKLVLVINEDDSYEWSWYAKVSTDYIFTGITTYQKTQDKHTSGSSIWYYSIWVDEINGTHAPGGWDGIATYEDPNTLILNVEPRIDGWSKYPTPEEGIGSGANGERSVYIFKKK